MVLTQIVRWADNTSDLRRNLAQGLDMIESTKQGALKMVEAMRGDKLIESAHRMTAAIGMLEKGVKALNPQEAASKLAFLEKAMDKLERTGRPIPSQMKATADSLRAIAHEAPTLSSRFSALGADVLKSAAGFATGLLSVQALQNGFRILKDFVVDCAKAFMQAEAANKRIDASLKASGQFTNSLSMQYRGLAEEMQRLTVNSDDANAESIALFVSLGRVGPQQMQAALEASANLSAALGKDLTDSTTLLSKAFGGNVTALQKLGIQIDSTSDKGQQFERVIAAVNARFGGQAQAAVETNIGQMKQLRLGQRDGDHRRLYRPGPGVPDVLEDHEQPAPPAGAGHSRSRGRRAEL
jgi:biotin operon repressor